jgi:tRNA dimethylallyltransferase
MIIIICGPTGIGKTSAAIEIAEALGTEIISADSMQIYRYMDIGTAKPTEAEQNRVRHHMIDIIDPDAPYDAARFGKDAYDAANRLLKQKKVPVVAGGTGLYIKSLIHGLFQADRPDPDVRRRLKTELETKGTEYMHARLIRLDPASGRQIHVNDRSRILRALEVVETTGKTISEWHRTHQFQEAFFETFKIGLTLDRDRIYRRINRRVDLMLDQGLLEEVRGLLEKGYNRELKSMQSLGYRHMLEFIDGRLTWEEAIRTMKRDTRRYAKRQFTWFKADSEIEWIEPAQIMTILPRIKRFIQSESGP